MKINPCNSSTGEYGIHSVTVSVPIPSDVRRVPGDALVDVVTARLKIDAGGGTKKARVYHDPLSDSLRSFAHFASSSFRASLAMSTVA